MDGRALDQLRFQVLGSKAMQTFEDHGHISEMLRLRDVTMVFKCLHGLAPKYLESKLVKRSAIHRHNTRRKNDINITLKRTSTAQRSILTTLYRRGITWAQQPKTVQAFPFSNAKPERNCGPDHVEMSDRLLHFIHPILEVTYCIWASYYYFSILEIFIRAFF